MKKYILHLLPDSTAKQMLDMGYSKKNILKHAIYIAISIVFFCVILLPYFVFVVKSTPLALLMPLGIVVTIMTIKQRVSHQYDTYTYQKHYDFLFFAKLVLSYLKSDNKDESLTSVLRKLANRMQDSPLYNSIAILATEILNTDQPQPFINFARRVSNTDLALDFSMALYDWSQKETRLSILERMETKITDGWIRFTQEIKNKKLQRLDYFGIQAFYVCLAYLLIVLGTVVVQKLAEAFSNI